MKRLFLAVLGLSATLAYAAPGSMIGFFGVGVLLCVLPGWGWQRCLLGASSHRLAERLALGAVFPAAFHGIVATLVQALEVSPVVVAGACALVGIAMFFASGRRPQATKSGFDTWGLLVLAFGLAVAVTVLVLPPSLGWTSDVYAHAAAVRGCMEEGRIFPILGFYAPIESTGADPRFGTGHALYAAWAQLAGMPALQSWHLLTAAAVLVHILAAGGLASALFTSLSPRIVTTLGFVAAFGGAFYNVLEVAAFPLWLGFSSILVMLMLLTASSDRHDSRRWVVAILVAGAAGLHIFAWILAMATLCVGVVSAGKSERKAWFRQLLAALIVAAPIVAIRLSVSYGSDNAVHERPWRVMQWADGWLAADPSYLLDWWFPFGFLGILVSPWLLRRASSSAVRLACVMALASLAWLTVPLLLTPSIKVLSFLPLRFTILVLFPVLLGATLEALQRRVALRKLVTTVILGGLAWSLWGRLTVLAAHEREPLATSASWRQIAQTLDEKLGPNAVVAADPFTMMLVRATASPRIMAVPTGRTSPRDPRPIERIQAAWAILSPSTSPDSTAVLLERHHVTHVLLNQSFTDFFYNEQYNIAPSVFAAQRRKFSPGDRFSLLDQANGLSLLEYHSDGAWNDEYLQDCVAVCPPLAPALSLSEAFQLSEVQMGVDATGSSISLRGWLSYAGVGSAPDRFLIIRADHVEGVVPPALRAVNKPYRKIVERLGGRWYRQRWTEYPHEGACQTYALATGTAMVLDLELAVSPSLAPGEYELHLQIANESGFTVLSPRDFLEDDDIYQGPVIGRFSVSDEVGSRISLVSPQPE